MVEFIDMFLLFVVFMSAYVGIEVAKVIYEDWRFHKE